MFEIHYTQHKLNLDGDHVITVSGKYQVSAKDAFDAAMKFGQVYHKVDDYEIHIKNIYKI